MGIMTQAAPEQRYTVEEYLRGLPAPPTVEKRDDEELPERARL